MEDEVLKLKNDTEFRSAARTEHYAMAQLFQNAIENGQEIEPMGHPANDIC
jgi:hypothetical protein